MKTCFQIAECSLSYAKITQKNEKRENKMDFYVIIPTSEDVYSDSSIRLMTTSAEISRLAASGITRLFLLSMTSSVTISPRRTGRQCMKHPLLVQLMCSSSMVQLMSLLNISPYCAGSFTPGQLQFLA